MTNQFPQIGAHSTNPGRLPKILTVELRQDDPAKCTSAKMTKFGLARRIRLGAIPRGAIVLNPFSERTLFRRDADVVLSNGLVIIDCSWVNAQEVFPKSGRGNHRRLPTLMAGNPTNYSRLQSLSSVEASAASLYIMNFRDVSRRLLSLYKWGQTFLSLNQDALDDYSKASSEEEVRELEIAYFSQVGRDLGLQAKPE